MRVILTQLERKDNMLKNQKSLVIYFSKKDENYTVGYLEKGNTEVIAEYIQELVNADLFQVERKSPYAKDYQTCTLEAKEELENNLRPELLHYLDNIDNYEVIYIGQPVWWDYPPMPMYTQLEKLNWQGKIVMPFTTHEGSGLGHCVSAIQKICVGAEVRDGLAIQGSMVKNAKSEVEKWIYQNEK